MRTLVALVGLLLLPSTIAAGKFCQLKGRVRIVSAQATYRVQQVNAFPDLRVQLVPSLPTQAGQWQIVGSGEDFTVQWVQSFPDFKVQIVNSFAGCPSR
jgi:hypothetical protein